MAKKTNYNEMNDAQLHEELSKQREELRNLRFAAAGARPKDSAAPRKTRAAIARIMTALHTRKNAAEAQA